jgi:hypothetical protein
VQIYIKVWLRLRNYLLQHKTRNAPVVAYTAHRQARTEKSSTGSVSDVRKESAGKFKAYSLGCLVEHAIRHFQRAGRAARPALIAVHMTIGIVQLALTNAAYLLYGNSQSLLNMSILSSSLGWEPASHL